MAETGIAHTAEIVSQHGPHISIKAETLFNLAGMPITNSLLTSWLTMLLLILLALGYKKNQFVHNLLNLILKPVYKLFEGVFGEKTAVFFPVVMTYFLYILSLNWFGLLPGVGTLMLKNHGHSIPLLRAGTADLNMTLAFGCLSIIVVQYYSVRYLGWGKYLKKFFNITNPINAFVGILELVSEFSKAISFSFRLFGNIFAGEVLLTVVAFLIPVLASFPFLLFEFFVGFIQALVFSMLSAIFISVAIADSGH
jgi:F-type H+-transporting ATPase subunit a